MVTVETCHQWDGNKYNKYKQNKKNHQIYFLKNEQAYNSQIAIDKNWNDLLQLKQF